MAFIPIQCSITADQAKKLLSGQTSVLRREQCNGGPHVLYLTQSQKDRLHKQNGIKLQFSKTQLKHNMKHGKGFWDIFKKGAKAVLPVLAEKGSKFLGDKAEKLLSNIPVVGPVLGQLANQGIQAGAQAGSDALVNKIGDGVGRRRKGKDFPAGYSAGRGGLYPSGYGRGLLPPPIKGANSNAAGI